MSEQDEKERIKAARHRACTNAYHSEYIRELEARAVKAERRLKVTEELLQRMFQPIWGCLKANVELVELRDDLNAYFEGESQMTDTQMDQIRLAALVILSCVKTPDDRHVVNQFLAELRPDAKYILLLRDVEAEVKAPVKAMTFEPEVD